jgi:mycobactin lysine-N-oxygenase
MKKLIIIGCGPKAVAIATKIEVLKKLGWEVPELIIIDKSGPLSNWDGVNGYTSGDLILGTLPFEDVGYPYLSAIDPVVDMEMLKFSWVAYQIDIGKYSEWVNRNLQAPTHRMFAEYFKWVVKKLSLAVIKGEVTKLLAKESKWEVVYKTNLGEEIVVGDGLVITGPGEPREFKIVGDQESGKKLIFNGQDLWHNLDSFKDIKKAKIAVIGGGETAAGIVDGLLSTIDHSSQIEIVTRHAMLFTRNQNWMEVMYFSTAQGWGDLSKKDRMEVIKSADRGTFSPGIKDLLDSAYNVSLKVGQTERIEVDQQGLHLVISANGEEQRIKYDYIVQATGFNSLSFTKFFNDKSFDSDWITPEKIDTDLSVMGMTAKLHLPNLAALNQGPGFPSLTCLGMLSERILKSYINK